MYLHRIVFTKVYSFLHYNCVNTAISAVTSRFATNKSIRLTVDAGVAIRAKSG